MTLTDDCDKSLVRACLKGDGAAFEEIIRRYGPSLLGYLTKMADASDRAEDLFQETFKRAYEKMHTFNGDNLRPWLFTAGLRTRRLQSYTNSTAPDCLLRFSSVLPRTSTG